jgi:hypothetical protein
LSVLSRCWLNGRKKKRKNQYNYEEDIKHQQKHDKNHCYNHVRRIITYQWCERYMENIPCLIETTHSDFPRSKKNLLLYLCMIEDTRHVRDLNSWMGKMKWKTNPALNKENWMKKHSVLYKSLSSRILFNRQRCETRCFPARNILKTGHIGSVQ